MNSRKNLKKNEHVFLSEKGWFLDTNGLKEVFKDESVDSIEYNETSRWVYFRITCTDNSIGWFFTSPVHWNIWNKNLINWEEEGF